MSLLHQTISLKNDVFRDLRASVSAANLGSYSSAGLPHEVTSIEFHDIAMSGFEAKLGSYLVNKR